MQWHCGVLNMTNSQDKSDASNKTPLPAPESLGSSTSCWALHRVEQQEIPGQAGGFLLLIIWLVLAGTHYSAFIYTLHCSTAAAESRHTETSTSTACCSH